MAERKPNFIERFLFGPNVNKGIEEKGNFPYNAAMRGNQYDWSTPTPNGYSITYGTAIDYAVETADLIDNSAVLACFMWICRTFPEPRFRVMKRVKGGKPVEVENHPLTLLFNDPNPYYPGELLLHPSLISYNWRGETYMRKIRNAQKQIIQLYYEPHWTCRPVRRSSEEFISNYQLYRDNKWVDVPTEDIVHIRQGMDPEDPMHGFNYMAAALREVFTDNAAARYASAMMRRLGVFGAIVTPKDPDIGIEDPVRLKAMLQSLSTGDERGSYGVFSEALDFNYPPNDPSKMDTRGNRKITEERISGLIGVPAIVAGLGAGLDRSTFANMGEAREMAYESNIIPTQRLWAAQFRTQLLSEMGDPLSEFVDWDYSQVRVLQDDENKKVMRLNSRLTSGGMSLQDYLSEVSGKTISDAENVWYIPMGVKVVKSPMEGIAQAAPLELLVGTDEDVLPDEPQALESAPKALVNGNGHLAGITITAGGSGYATPLPLYGEKARKVTQESVLEDILRDTKAELERVYSEAEKAVGG